MQAADAPKGLIRQGKVEKRNTINVGTIEIDGHSSIDLAMTESII